MCIFDSTIAAIADMSSVQNTISVDSFLHFPRCYVSMCVSISHCSSKLASHWHFYPHFVAFVLLKQRFYFVNIFCFVSVFSRQSKRIRNILIEHTHTDREMNKLKLGLLELVKNRTHRCGTISSFNWSTKFYWLLFIIWHEREKFKIYNIWLYSS